MARKASVATRNPVMHNMVKCPCCNGGEVLLYVSGEFVEAMTCPECLGLGMLTPKAADCIIDGNAEIAAYMADIKSKY